MLGIRLVIACLEFGFISFAQVSSSMFCFCEEWLDGSMPNTREMSVIHLYILYAVWNSALERQSLGSSTGERIFNRPKVP